MLQSVIIMSNALENSVQEHVNRAYKHANKKEIDFMKNIGIFFQNTSFKHLWVWEQLQVWGTLSFFLIRRLEPSINCYPPKYQEYQAYPS